MKAKTILRCCLMVLVFFYSGCVTTVNENELDIKPQVKSGKILNLRNDGSSIELTKAENLMKSGFLNTKGGEYGYYRVEFDVDVGYITDNGVGAALTGLTFGLYNLFGGALNSNDIGLAAILSFYDSNGTLLKRYQKTDSFTQQAGIYYGGNATRRVSRELTKMFAIVQREADKDSAEINRLLQDAGPISPTRVVYIQPTIPPKTPEVPEPRQNYLLEIPHQYLEHKASQEWANSPLKADPKEIKSSDIKRTAPKYTVGSSKKEFWVQDKEGNWQQINTTLQAQGQGKKDFCNIWVADASFSNDSKNDKSDSLLTKQQAALLAEKFNNIYEAETNLFGYEFGGGPKGNGGLDGDKRVQILVYDIADAGVAGYFWEKDEYKGELGESCHSNMCEVFYLDAPEIDSNPGYMYSSMIHVFQYMINFNEKKLRLNQPIDPWYNVMLSQMAKDVIAPSLGVKWYDPAHVIQADIRRYFQYSEKLELTDWKYDYLHPYYNAQATAFAAYLTRNFGGPKLVYDIMRNNEVNLASIDAALAKRGSSYDDARARFPEVLEYSTFRGIPEGKYSYDKPAKDRIGSIQYTFDAFDLFNESFTEIKAKYDVPEIKKSADSYEVKPGDRLAAIAHKYYGRSTTEGYYFPLIMLATSFDIPNPDLINNYRKLTIPKLDAVREDTSAKENIKGYFNEAAEWYTRNRADDVATARGIRQAAEKL